MPVPKKRREAPNGADVGRESKKAARETLKGLVAVASAATPKTKHHTYFEFVENKDKKKKLEFQITTQTEPPPGFEFVPTGNPELAIACKELSREKEALIFIVSDSRSVKSDNIAHQVHRIGHHIRQSIVEEARRNLAHLPNFTIKDYNGAPEPIPESQEEYNSQVNAAIRDLFPRIPHTDRLQIIQHAFRLQFSGKGEPPVGLSADITLARRVQLATLAHIRHTHTRYDQLIRESDRATARKLVERPCLDVIVKWRGDEETGRDQLEEILREVVVISDSEEESDEESSDTSMDEGLRIPRPNLAPAQDLSNDLQPRNRDEDRMSIRQLREARAAERKNQRGFKRYRAFEEARQRNEGFVSTDQAKSILAPPPVIVSRPVNDPYEHRAWRGLPQEPRPPLPGNPPSFHNSNSASPVQPPLERFAPPRREHPLSASALNPPASPEPNRFQDLLVPSVEPVSPEASSSVFVRMVPPRIMPKEPPHSRPRSEVFANRPRSPVSYTREDPRRDVRSFGEPVRPSHPFLEPIFIRPRASDYQVPADSMSRLHLGGRAPEQPPARIRVETGRPGDRSNPIIMEDRGGFYEKVPVQPDQQRIAGRRRVVAEMGLPGDRSNPMYMEDQGGFYEEVPVQPVQQGFAERPRPAPGQTAHRIVSSEEGSRILWESRGSDVEVFPVVRSRGAPQSQREALYDLVPRDLSGSAYSHPVNSRVMPPDYAAPTAERMSLDPPLPRRRAESTNPSFWEIRRDGVATHFTPVSEQRYSTDGERDSLRHTAQNPIVID